MLKDRWLALPRLTRFMIDHFATGAAMGAGFGLLMIRMDIAGLRTLLEGAETAGPTALFLAQGALTFGAMSIAVAVCGLPDAED